MAESIIELQGLTKKFCKTYALKNINMTLPEGIVFGLLGPNGAGKTTMIRLLLGLLEPSDGKGFVMGYDIVKQSSKIRENTGVLLENNGLYDKLTVYDNLEFYGRIWRLSKNERKFRINELLHYFELEDKKNIITETLSKGMKQKLAIARALIHKPKLTFLDEPTSGLDPMSVIALRNCLSKMAKDENKTIFLNTHNLNEAEILCDMVGIIQEGELIAIDKTQNLCQKFTNEFITLIIEIKDQESIESLKRENVIEIIDRKDMAMTLAFNDITKFNYIISNIISNGGSIIDIKKNKSNLEDVFLNLIKKA